MKTSVQTTTGELQHCPGESLSQKATGGTALPASFHNVPTRSTMTEIPITHPMIPFPFPSFRPSCTIHLHHHFEASLNNHNGRRSYP